MPARPLLGPHPPHRPGRLLRAVLAAAGAAMLAVTAGLAPAQGAAAGWRVAATVGQSSQVTSLLDPGGGNGGDGFVATAANDAWSVWRSCAPASCGTTVTTIVEHWNGTAWQRVPASLLSGLTSPDAVAAYSATDAWLFNGSLGAATALHWNGTAWAPAVLPPWAIKLNLSGSVQLAAADFGPGGVWVFSLGQQSLTPVVPYAARYDGQAWSQVTLPAIPTQVAAVSASDIWALGIPADLSGGQLLMHWDGRAWNTVGLPRPQIPPGGTVTFTGAASSGPADLWLEQIVQAKPGGAATISLEHWNGTAWQQVPLNYPASSVDATASDGHGGLWMAFNGPLPAATSYFAHLTSGGSWSRTVVPPPTGTTVQQASVITAVPGSTSAAWAAGQVLVPGQGSGGIVGAIWRH